MAIKGNGTVTRPSVGQSVSQLVSQSVSQLVSQSVCLSVSQTKLWYWCNSIFLNSDGNQRQ